MPKKSVFTSKSFLSSRGMTKIFMAFAIIGFSMPFLTVSCGSNMITSVTGYELITGKDVYVLNEVYKLPADFMVFIAFISCLVTMAAAFLPAYTKSRLIWGISSFVGLIMLVLYYMLSTSKMLAEGVGRVGYDISGQLSILPGRGLMLCIMLQLSSLVMLIRKKFFEEPDLLKITIDEAEIIEAIEKDVVEEERERVKLKKELAEKLAPIEKKDLKKESATQEVMEKGEIKKELTEEPEQMKEDDTKKELAEEPEQMKEDDTKKELTEELVSDENKEPKRETEETTELTGKNEIKEVQVAQTEPEKEDEQIGDE